MKHAVTLAVVLLAFGAGFGVARMTPPAAAQSTPIAPQAIDIGTLTLDTLPAVAPNNPLHAKYLLVEDPMQLGVQIGATSKHLHTQSDEVQYDVEGSGTEWLGDKQVALHPGMLLIIPKNTPHGGIVETGGHIKLIAIHTPPIPPGTTHPVP